MLHRHDYFRDFRVRRVDRLGYIVSKTFRTYRSHNSIPSKAITKSFLVIIVCINSGGMVHMAVGTCGGKRRILHMNVGTCGGKRTMVFEVMASETGVLHTIGVGAGGYL